MASTDLPDRGLLKEVDRRLLTFARTSGQRYAVCADSDGSRGPLRIRVLAAEVPTLDAALALCPDLVRPQVYMKAGRQWFLCESED